MHIDYAMLYVAHLSYVFKCTGIGTCFHLGYHTWWACDQVSMALAFNNNHMIHCHMYMQWSMALAWTYFVNPSLVAQCCVCATCLSPDTINQIEPHTYHYTKFFEGVVGYIPLGIPST